jgi:hypothetical protein
MTRSRNMNAPTSRRGLLCGLAVAPLTGSAAIASGAVTLSPHPDGELIELGRKFEAAQARERATWAAWRGRLCDAAAEEACEAAAGAVRQVSEAIQARTPAGLATRRSRSPARTGMETPREPGGCGAFHHYM